MRRWSFHIPCLLSLLLSLSVTSIWIYGRWHDINLHRRYVSHKDRISEDDFIHTCDDRLLLQAVSFRGPTVDRTSSPDVIQWNSRIEPAYHANPWNYGFSRIPNGRGVNFLGFRYHYQIDPFGADSKMHDRTLAIPFSVLVTIFAILPAIWLIRFLRRLHQPGHCPHCGYDLRASSDRCPECGISIQQDQQATLPAPP
jgi:hypothetical protein